MKFHLRADEANGTHTKITVFANGANCGQLCMNEEEALFFHDMILRSPWTKPEEVRTSGQWFLKKKGREG